MSRMFVIGLWLMSGQSPSDFKTPRQLWVAIIGCLAVAGILTWVVFQALSSLAQEHQAFWSGLAGSVVGSAVAFGLAAWLWRMERHVLVAERKSDRAEARRQDLIREDARNLRDCLSIVGNLRALNYHLVGEKRFATARDQYLMRLRFEQAVSLINDDALRQELAFMAKMVDDDQALDHFIASEWQRLNIVQSWLLRVIAMESSEVFQARPKNYDLLRSKMRHYDEYVEEQRELAAEAEKDRKSQTATEAPQSS